MSEKEHALLSASSAHRWLACPISARLEELTPDTESESAKEGTLAHEMAELKLRNLLIEPMPKRTFNSRMKKLKEDPLYKKEMDGYTDDYAMFVREISLLYPEKPFIAAEQRVDYAGYAPEGFGTADCILISGENLHIIDFKYGKNVTVSAEDNPQLKLYALGALSEYALFFSIKNVHMHIYQPRAYDDAVRYSKISADDLRAWGNSIKETAQLAFLGEGEQETGTHCVFCKVSGTCRQVAKEKLSLEVHGFKLPPILLPEEVAEILHKAKNLAAWVKKLEEWALSYVLSGGQLDGWKAVEGRSQRTWIDQEKAFKALIDGGIDEELLYERKPLTIKQIEDEIGKKEFKNLVSAFVEKAPGKPTLVDESDKREAITNLSNAQEDFKNE